MNGMCGCAGRQVLGATEPRYMTPEEAEKLWPLERQGEGATAYVPMTEQVFLKVPEVATLKDSGQREHFPSGMVRDTRRGKGRYDLVSPYALRALAMIMEDGCEKYGERNWEQGCDQLRFFDSCLRHLMQWRMGMTDERHLRHAFWNLHCMVHFDEKARATDE